MEIINSVLLTQILSGIGLLYVLHHTVNQDDGWARLLILFYTLPFIVCFIFVFCKVTFGEISISPLLYLLISCGITVFVVFLIPSVLYFLNKRSLRKRKSKK